MLNKAQLDFDIVMDRFKFISKTNTIQQIAATLGLGERQFQNYKKNSELPLGHIVKWCINNKIDLNWLIYGSATKISIDDPLPHGFIKIPFYPDLKASAGGGCTNNDDSMQDLKYISIDSTSLPYSTNDHKLFAIKAIGDSMSENIKDGALLICDSNDTDFSHGKIFIVSAYNETFVKRLFRGTSDEAVILHSDNPFYGEEEVPCSAVQIVAKVVRFYNGANV